jgi:hypothetical protein
VVGQRANQPAILISGLRLTCIAALAAMLAACGRSGSERDATAAEIARAGGLEPVASTGAVFDLKVYRRDDRRAGSLFYLYRGRRFSLCRFAHAFHGSNAGRFPGAATRRGRPGRFGVDVVASIDDAVDRERIRAPERPLVFVGYSGGGVISSARSNSSEVA